MNFVKKLRDIIIAKNSERAKQARRENAYYRLVSSQTLKQLKENKPWEEACEKAAENGETSISIMIPLLIPKHRTEISKFIEDQGFEMVFWKKRYGDWCLVIDWRDRSDPNIR